MQLALESGGTISFGDAFAMASSNIEKLLGVDLEATSTDLAVTTGSDLFSFEAKVIGMISPRREVVELF